MPRPGPRRPLFSARVDTEDFDWVKAQAEREGAKYPDFARRTVAFAHLHMPFGWTKPELPPEPDISEEPLGEVRDETAETREG